MYLSKLKLFQFRNIAEQELQFSRDLNLIHGRNGQGKTAVIEGIHLLSSTKSFRTSKAREIPMWGTHEASVHGTAELETGPVELGAVIQSGKKKFFVDSHETGAVQFVGRLLCVTFSPGDIELVKGTPAVRRQFLDKHSVDLQPGLLHQLMQYNQALRSKQLILKKGTGSDHTLEPWDRILAETSKAIILARRRFVTLLSNVLSHMYRQFASADGIADVSLRESFKDSDPTAERIYSALEQSRRKDISLGTAGIGPHRDDFEVTINQKSSRLYASQGQSKSLALALKISALRILEEVRSEKAIFLLDDVDSELDEDRLRRLYTMIQEGERQVIVTGTEPRLGYVSPQNLGRIYRVENGSFIE